MVVSDNQQLLMLGAGGHAKVVLDIAMLSSLFDEIGIYDDRYDVVERLTVLGMSVIGGRDAMLNTVGGNKNPVFIVAIGNNVIRAQHFMFLLEHNLMPVSLLKHPSAIVADTASIGKGSVLMAGSVVNPNAHLGKNSIINTHAVVEHDCYISDHVHISPNATVCGGASVGDLTWIGAGSVVIEGVVIGRNCVIGAGAVVTQNIPDNTLAVGVPAQPKKILMPH